jgi:hypothetical protein
MRGELYRRSFFWKSYKKYAKEKERSGGGGKCTYTDIIKRQQKLERWAKHVSAM